MFTKSLDKQIKDAVLFIWCVIIPMLGLMVFLFCALIGNIVGLIIGIGIFIIPILIVCAVIFYGEENGTSRKD